MKEIIKAFSKVVVTGLLEWKFPLFLGFLLTVNSIALFMSEALREYNDWAAVPPLTWMKLFLGSLSAGCAALIPFLNSTVARTRDQVKEDRKNGEDHNPTP